MCACISDRTRTRTHAQRTHDAEVLRSCRVERVTIEDGDDKQPHLAPHVSNNEADNRNRTRAPRRRQRLAAAGTQRLGCPCRTLRRRRATRGRCRLQWVCPTCDSSTRGVRASAHRTNTVTDTDALSHTRARTNTIHTSTRTKHANTHKQTHAHAPPPRVIPLDVNGKVVGRG
jgi:hypothetical protein